MLTPTHRKCADIHTYTYTYINTYIPPCLSITNSAIYAYIHI
jgi:hypothetical protein